MVKRMRALEKLPQASLTTREARAIATAEDYRVGRDRETTRRQLWEALTSALSRRKQPSLSSLRKKAQLAQLAKRATRSKGHSTMSRV